jgi:hypothetical protein
MFVIIKDDFIKKIYLFILKRFHSDYYTQKEVTK